MDNLTTFQALIISLPIAVTFFFTFYLLKIGRIQPSLSTVSKRTVIFLWIWFFAAAAIAYFGVFSDSVSFKNGDTLTFSIYASLISFGPTIGWIASTQSESFRKLITAIPAHILVGSQIIRLGGYAYWDAYKAGEIPFHLGLSIAGMDVFLALCAPFLAYSLYKNYRWAASATVAWAFIGLFDVLNGTVQMIMIFIGLGGMESVAINLPLSNLIELYQVGIGIIIHVLLINRYIKTKSLK
ncbi:MAG: hypothetical protein NWR73_00970 [Flavobacteriales bacterium]|nr:hypothetical protein [Flavobacteriales bacterium]